jgi:hypothetical protein
VSGVTTLERPAGVEPGTPERFPALTVWQPWATLIALGLKDIENRPWTPSRDVRGGPLYIHAGKRWDSDGFRTAADLAGGAFPRDPDFYPLGAVIARVTLVDSHWSSACLRGKYGDLHPDGPYQCSRWAMGGNGGLAHWRLSDPVVVPEPVPCRGFQKVWTLPPDVAARVATQLGEVADA